jgi:hypothetical protein
MAFQLSGTSGLQLPPIIKPMEYPKREVFPTYQVVMDALNKILPNFDPEVVARRRLAMAQAANLPQRIAMQNRELALKGRQLGMEERLLPAKEKMTEAQYKAITEGMSGGGGDANGFWGQDGKWHRYTQAEKGAQRSASWFDRVKAAHQQGATKGPAVTGAVPVPMRGANTVTPTPQQPSWSTHPEIFNNPPPAYSAPPISPVGNPAATNVEGKRIYDDNGNPILSDANTMTSEELQRLLAAGSMAPDIYT